MRPVIAAGADPHLFRKQGRGRGFMFRGGKEHGQPPLGQIKLRELRSTSTIDQRCGTQQRHDKVCTMIMLPSMIQQQLMLGTH